MADAAGQYTKDGWVLRKDGIESRQYIGPEHRAGYTFYRCPVCGGQDVSRRRFMESSADAQGRVRAFVQEHIKCHANRRETA